MNHLQGVKVGDTLLVVGRSGKDQQALRVSKVGREYATCGEGSFGSKYRLSNGHQGYVNGFSQGGTAYLSAEHFEQRQRADEAWTRLVRLCYGGRAPSHLSALDIHNIIITIDKETK